MRDLVLTCSGEWTWSVMRQTAVCWSLECHLSGGEWLPLETGTCNTQESPSPHFCTELLHDSSWLKKGKYGVVAAMPAWENSACSPATATHG